MGAVDAAGDRSPTAHDIWQYLDRDRHASTASTSTSGSTPTSAPPTGIRPPTPGRCETEHDGAAKTYRGRFLFFGTGYYNYDEPYTPEFPGIEDFAGEVVHPQYWPESLDYTGKRIVVIGSGATAVSMIPSLTEKAASRDDAAALTVVPVVHAARSTRSCQRDPKSVAAHGSPTGSSGGATRCSSW